MEDHNPLRIQNCPEARKPVRLGVQGQSSQVKVSLTSTSRAAAATISRTLSIVHRFEFDGRSNRVSYSSGTPLRVSNTPSSSSTPAANVPNTPSLLSPKAATSALSSHLTSISSPSPIATSFCETTLSPLPSTASASSGPAVLQTLSVGTPANPPCSTHVATYEADAYFAFHTLNAWDDGDDVVFDVSTYDDASIMSRTNDFLELEPAARPMASRHNPTAQVRRYRLRDVPGVTKFQANRSSCMLLKVTPGIPPRPRAEYDVVDEDVESGQYNQRFSRRPYRDLCAQA
ncbi:hypothetical protein BC936DRAFT_136631 [Jimgerdemannia flammicorona]|uniref:Uncharacterized protein n=1 Tax=Jimgerdemannia flammicorona TaxID=994334 RepID=A0A433DJF0_9FUNG|nr:hypothetical protein BC936DRAFT_136631 [Jimgerdemannia flammicorona]